MSLGSVERMAAPPSTHNPMALSQIGCLGCLEGRRVATTRLLYTGVNSGGRLRGLGFRVWGSGFAVRGGRIEGIAAFAVSAR